MVKEVVLNDGIIFGNQKAPFVLLAGPCVLEDAERVKKIAYNIKEITEKLQIPFVFKSSFDKANRSSIDSYRGPGIEQGLELLGQIKDEYYLPIITDIHEPGQVPVAAEVADILQVPAFLSRQTDLVVAAGESGKIVNIKKGQFLAPWDIDNVVKKIESTGNTDILLTERGVSFGYNNLVVDFRSLPRMRETGYPVVFDATHSVQLPGDAGNKSDGDREYVPYLTRAAVGAGIDALFMEVHDQPEEALSDSASMIKLSNLKSILKQALAIDQAVRDM